MVDATTAYRYLASLAEKVSFDLEIVSPSAHCVQVVCPEAKLILGYYPSKASYNFQGAAVAKDRKAQKAKRGKSIDDAFSAFINRCGKIREISAREAAIVHCPGCRCVLYDLAARDGWCTNCNPANRTQSPEDYGSGTEKPAERKWNMFDPEASRAEPRNLPLQPEPKSEHAFVIRTMHRPHLYLSCTCPPPGSGYCWRTQLALAIQFLRKDDAKSIGLIQGDPFTICPLQHKTEYPHSHADYLELARDELVQLQKLYCDAIGVTQSINGVAQIIDFILRD